MLRSASPDPEARPEPIAISAIRGTGDHLQRPRREAVEHWLTQKGRIQPHTDDRSRQEAVQEFYAAVARQSRSWTSPEVQRQAERREAESAFARMPSGTRSVQPVTVRILVLAVDFDDTASDTIAHSAPKAGGGCETKVVTTRGPRRGNIPAPGLLDNNTVWYTPAQTADPAFYGRLIFGYEGVGRIRSDLTDPVDGQKGINLAGFTVQDYYDKTAGSGNVTLSGRVEGWVTVPHSEAYYGADDCSRGTYYSGAGVSVGQLAVDAIQQFCTLHPASCSSADYWSQFDGDQDGLIDSLWIIHAGMGQESGGGAEGAYAIWSHSSDLRSAASPKGYRVFQGATAAEDKYIGPYTMQPENATLGVLVEEFGHNFFGLPDLYTTDTENSVAFWSVMSSGTWGGYLGGSAPVGMPLYFRMIARCGSAFCNWQEPMAIRSFRDPAAAVTLGPLEETPAGQNKGVQVHLPDIQETIGNPAGSGKAAYTDRNRNSLDITLDRPITPGSAAGGLLTFDAYWDIEAHYDYGYLQLREGDGDWIFLHDADGVMTSSNPNGSNLGWGLTGKAPDVQQTLRFDLSAFRGKACTLRWRYRTDPEVTGSGWWFDNLRLDGTLIDNFEEASGTSGFSGWTNSAGSGWIVAPLVKNFPNYYLVEWRAPVQYDKMLSTAYVTTYYDADEWRVERVPYNIPGALLYYRNQKYPNNQNLRTNHADPPGLGPKYPLLVVDMNCGPLRLTSGASTYTLDRTATGYDAALTLQPAAPFLLNRFFSAGAVMTGPWTFPAVAAVREFSDAQGYYAGVYPCTLPGGYCYSNQDGSAVIPAKGPYSLRVVHYDGTPYPEQYGLPFPNSSYLLGSGNPGDQGLQYGVRFRLASQSADGRIATLQFDNPFTTHLPFIQR